MKLAFFGTGAFGIPSLDALAGAGHSILTVVTSCDKPAGRSLATVASPVKEWAVRHDLPVKQYAALTTAAAADLTALHADAFIVIDYGLILPRNIFSIPRTSLNVHASLLPKFRGASPVQRAILEGETETGVSVIRLSERLDAGDVITQKRCLIQDSDDARLLEEKLAVLGGEALLEALAALERGTAAPRPQDERLATLAPKISKAEGRIGWKRPARSIVNQVRAFAEWPSAYFFCDGKRVIVKKAVFEELAVPPAAPGTVIAASRTEGLRVAAPGGAVRMLELQLEGRKALPAADFLNGFRIEAGRVLE